MYMSGNTLTRSPQNVKKDRLRSIVEVCCYFGKYF